MLLTGLACPSVDDCIAVGDHEVLATGDGGSSWRRVELASDLVGEVTAVACPAPDRCYLVGSSPGGGPGTVVPAGTDAARAWQLLARLSTADVTIALSCPARLVCFALGGAGSTPASEVLSTRDGGSRWSVVSIRGAVSLNAISCPDTTHCVGVGGGPFNVGRTAFYTTDGGRSWVSARLPAGEGAPFAGLDGVACDNPPVCIAVGGGPMLASSDDGTSSVLDSSSRALGRRSRPPPRIRPRPRAL